MFAYQGAQSDCHIWKFDPSLADPSNLNDFVDLDWENARRLRISWHAKTSTDPVVNIEASLFEPLANKTVASQLFSSTAARVAIVAFVDSRDEARTPLFQRNALFGDSASSQPSEPEVIEVIDVDGNAHWHFALCTRDAETIDLPLPNSYTLLDLLVVKYFPLGQVIACGWRNA